MMRVSFAHCNTVPYCYPQMYARDIKYLAEWLLNPDSTDGSGLGTSTYAALLSKVTMLRKKEGLKNDNKVVFDGYILHGTPGKYLENLWDSYRKCEI